jgi:hypothetical protein
VEGTQPAKETQGEYRKTHACAGGEQRPYLGNCKGPEGKWHRHTSKRGACVSLRLQNWSILLQLATYTGNPRMGLPVDHRVIRWPKGRDVLSALLRCRARGRLDCGRVPWLLDLPLTTAFAPGQLPRTPLCRVDHGTGDKHR